MLIMSEKLIEIIQKLNFFFFKLFFIIKKEIKSKKKYKFKLFKPDIENIFNSLEIFFNK